MSAQRELEQGAVRTLAPWVSGKGHPSFGINIPNSERGYFDGTPRWSDMLAQSKTAAAVGFDTLWFDDHFSFPEGDDGLRGQWEAWTLMAALAAEIPDVLLGPMVACTAYRNPGVIAKMTEMIDEISDGRFILGLGAGWQKDEYDQFGIRFEPRVSQFAEALQIIHGLLRDGAVDYQGEYYQANHARNLPRGPRPLGAPILIGSSAPRMLKLLVRYAEAWNTGGGSIEDVKAKVERLDAACAEAGRDPATVYRTIGHSIELDNGQLPNGMEAEVARVTAYRDLGFQHIMIRIKPTTVETIELVAPLIAAAQSA